MKTLTLWFADLKGRKETKRERESHREKERESFIGGQRV